MGQNPIQQKERKVRDKKIFNLYRYGLTYRELGKKYNLSFERIRQIVKRKWGELHD